MRQIIESFKTQTHRASDALAETNRLREILRDIDARLDFDDQGVTFLDLLVQRAGIRQLLEQA